MDGKQQDEPSWQFKPGETVSPRVDAPSQTPQPAVTAMPTPVVSAEIPQPDAPPVQQAVETPAPPQEPRPNYEELPQQETEVSQSTGAAEESLTWTASEYIAHGKSAGWHIVFILASLAIAVVTWLITKDVFTAVIIVLAGVVLSLYGGRQPKALQYQLDNHGLIIGQKQFLYSDFKAFSVIQEGQFESISLLPTKRFMPMTSLYFDPKDADQIIDILGMHLPHQERKADAVDNLMRKIRF